jgi:hypothetical protein
VRTARGELALAVDAFDEMASVRNLEGILTFAAPAVMVDAMVNVGRGVRFIELATSLRDTPWLQAARQIGEGDWLAAVAIYEAMPSPPDSSLARLRAAQAIADADMERALEIVAPAVEWFRRAGATRYLREAAGIRVGSVS